MSSTHSERLSEDDYETGYRVTIQHCEKPGCDEYLGVNYPSEYCTPPFQTEDHRPRD